MHQKSKNPINYLLLLFLLSASLVFTPALTRAQPGNSEQQEPPTFYLPLVHRENNTSIFGVETWNLNHPYTVPMAENADVKWLRNFTINWAEIEPEPGTYLWNSETESGLKNAAARGLTVVAMVKYTPLWAQRTEPYYYGYYCGPVKEDAFDEFAAFLQQVVRRYSVYPYNLKYIEIGNEPDVAPIYDVGDTYSDFGCWGNKYDAYYGGGYYAKMLKAVYPAIKAVDPSVQVLIGGLLLAKDPTTASYFTAPRFFEGILRAGGGPYFDIVSFHSFPAWTEITGISYEQYHPDWIHRVGMIEGKVSALREIMTRYGVNKPIFQSEAALNCYYDNKTGTDFCADPVQMAKYNEAMADYLVELYVRNWARGLIGTNWYTIDYDGFKHSGLLFSDGTGKPAYHALVFLRSLLKDASYSNQIPIGTYDPTLLRAYEFKTYAKRIWVIWIVDMCPEDKICVELDSATITLPQGWLKVMDKYGNTIEPVNGTILLQNTSPVYLELEP